MTSPLAVAVVHVRFCKLVAPFAVIPFAVVLPYLSTTNGYMLPLKRAYAFEVGRVTRWPPYEFRLYVLFVVASVVVPFTVRFICDA